MAEQSVRSIIPEVASSEILVVDDDADTRAIVSFALSKDNHNIVEAVDGRDAIECCKKSLPDLIITDIMMPNVDGNEFVRWFRAEYREQFIPILMLTAHSEIEQKVKGLASGADDYLTKPFNHRELIARVNALLRTKVLTESLQQRSLELEAANQELRQVQNELIAKERQLVAMQLAGATAHGLGQPITSILLNCRVLQQFIGLEKESDGGPGVDHEKARKALLAIQSECESARDILSKLRGVDPNQTQEYVGEMKILDLSAKQGK